MLNNIKPGKLRKFKEVLQLLNADTQFRRANVRNLFSTSDDALDFFYAAPKSRLSRRDIREVWAVGEQILSAFLDEEQLNDDASSAWGADDGQSLLLLMASIGDLMAEDGRTGEAKEIFERIVARDSSNILNCRAEACSCLIELKQFDDARALMQGRKRDSQSSDLYHGFLIEFAGNGRSRVAEDLLLAAARKNPYILGYLTGKWRKSTGELYPEPGSKDEAAAYFKHARRAWESVPDAIDFVKSQVRECPEIFELYQPLFKRKGKGKSISLEIVPTGLTREFMEFNYETEKHIEPLVYRMASILLEASPWTALGEEPFACMNPITGDLMIGILMGQLGDLPGMQLFFDQEDFFRFTDTAEVFLHFRDFFSMFQTLAEISYTKLTFESRMETDPEDRARYERFMGKAKDPSSMYTILSASNWGTGESYPTEYELLLSVYALAAVEGKVHRMLTRSKQPPPGFIEKFGIELPPAFLKRLKTAAEKTVPALRPSPTPTIVPADFIRKYKSRPRAGKWDGVIAWLPMPAINTKECLRICLLADKESGYVLGTRVEPCSMNPVEIFRRALKEAVKSAGAFPDSIEVPDGDYLKPLKDTVKVLNIKVRAGPASAAMQAAVSASEHMRESKLGMH